MFEKIKKHAGYYFLLFAILSIGLFLTFSMQDKQSQMLVITFTAFLYVGWGILHHLLHHELTPKIVVEYVLMAALGLTLIFFLLKGGFL